MRGAVRLPVGQLDDVLGVTFLPSQLRSTDSSTMRIDTGRRATLGNCLASSGSEKNEPALPEAVLKVCRRVANAWGMARLLREGALDHQGEGLGHDDAAGP